MLLFFFSNFVYIGLQVSLLVRIKETDSLLVNFDPAITQLIRETDCFIKMDVEVPDPAKQIFQRQDQLKEYQDNLKVRCWI